MKWLQHQQTYSREGWVAADHCEAHDVKIYLTTHLLPLTCTSYQHNRHQAEGAEAQGRCMRLQRGEEKRCLILTSPGAWGGSGWQYHCSTAARLQFVSWAIKPFLCTEMGCNSLNIQPLTSRHEEVLEAYCLWLPSATEF